jgi:aromatic ring-cleaving dioxygenase
MRRASDEKRPSEAFLDAMTPSGDEGAMQDRHVYFNEKSRPAAATLQASLLRDLPKTIHVSRLVDRPIGPHPLPMFELGFTVGEYPLVRGYLEAHRGELDILVHQLTPDEVWDHTEGAEWLGQPQVLNIQFLRDFMDGKVGPVSENPFGAKK